MLKKNILLIITIGYSLALITVCLIKLNNIPDIGVSFGDKIFHFLAYGLLTFLWFYTFIYAFRFKKKKAILSASILSVIFGIIIEVLQGSVTVSRQFDVYDVIANTMGVLLISLVLTFVKKIHIKSL